MHMRITLNATKKLGIEFPLQYLVRLDGGVEDARLIHEVSHSVWGYPHDVRTCNRQTYFYNTMQPARPLDMIYYTWQNAYYVGTFDSTYSYMTERIKYA